MVRFLAGILLASSLYGAGRESVIFDTDAGPFGDDGAALVMLARSPAQIALEGIIVTPGNVWAAQGAEYTFHILDLLQRPFTPVYTSAEKPLVHSIAMAREAEKRWGTLTYWGAFAARPADTVPAPGAKLSGRRARRGAAEYLIAEIERRPGELTILETAPMTNLALALRLRPDIETKIRRVVFMGGNVRVAGNASAAAEFNFWFDPDAARIVLRSRIPEKVMFGLDICNTAPLRKREFDQIAAARTPITDLFREDLGKRYPGFLRRPNAVAYLWDSLAAAFLLDPGFVTKSEVRFLDVEANWGKFYGATKPLDRRLAPEATPITVMLELNYERVFALFRKLMTM
jgi:inosine-uridine nucleoside N-ribohydrolase